MGESASGPNAYIDEAEHLVRGSDGDGFVSTCFSFAPMGPLPASSEHTH